jgi:hypothetical protein
MSQQLSHQVLVPVAGVASSSNISYSQTGGETAVEIVGCNSYIFTQGFQQPGIKVSDEERPEGTGVSVAPNPVYDFMTIKIYSETSKNLKMEIMTVNGQVIYSQRLSFNDSFFYEKSYDADKMMIQGIYFVRITSMDGIINRTFKIEKI